MRKELKFEVNQAKIKVPFDELLYDIIFVIVISKVTEMLFSAEQITPTVVISSLVIFTALVWVWLFRVNQLNNIHILQTVLDDYSLKSERITYLEIIVLVTVLFSLHNFSYQFLIMLLMIVLVITQFSVIRIRKKIIFNTENRLKFEQFHNHQHPDRFKRIVNVEYVFERFGVIFVLFMGEILSAAFNQVQQISNFFIIAVLVVCMFNANIKILQSSKRSLEAESNPRLYRLTIEYVKALLTLLLAIMVCIEAIGHYTFSSILIMTVMFVYFHAENKMKKALNIPGLNIALFANLAAVLLLVLNVPIDDIFKFIFGIIIFGINMYIAD